MSAAAGVSIAELGQLFIDYLPEVVETLNNEVLGRKMARNDYKWEGEKIEMKIHMKRNVGIGYTDDGGALPVAGRQTYVPGFAYRKNLVGSVQATDGALATAATKKRAARDTATSELRGMMEGLAKLENFMMYRDGTGVIGLLGTDITGTEWGITDARGVWDDQTYEIRDSAAIGTLHGTVKAKSVARALDANGDAVVTSFDALPPGSAAGDYVVWPNSVNRAITGLDALIDDGTGSFQGVTVSDYPRYTSPVLSNGGVVRALTPTLFRQMLAAIRQESGNVPNRSLSVLTNVWETIEVEELYESELRLTADSKVGGFVVASFQSSLGKINIVPDTDAPYNKMFFVDWSQVYRAVQKELDWRRNDKNGSIFTKSDQSLVYRANALEICEYFIKQRNRCGKIEDLEEQIATAY
jgi:hypothetical protein